MSIDRPVSGGVLDQMIVRRLNIDQKLKNETNRAEKYRTALKDILDAFWDMSPLEYAQSRGLPSMSDKTGEEILSRARDLLDQETT